MGLHSISTSYCCIILEKRYNFYQSSQLKIPDNILLVFQLPYSPELNPSERVWQYIKQELSGELYDNLDEIK
jgi:transposase